MDLVKVINLINAKIVAGEGENKIVNNGFCSDLLSDVLTIETDRMLLITGLANIQTIRTAEMADVQCILLVRDKKATTEMIKLAEENGMVLMETSLSMFNAAGQLYQIGLKPVY